MAKRFTHKPRKASDPPRVTPASALAEVLANIKAQRLGPAIVADLGLPEPFLARVAGRIMQAWYHERFRIVVDDTGAAPGPPPREAPGGHAESDLNVIHINCPALPVSPEAPAAPPPSRNFRLTSGQLGDFPYASSPEGSPVPQLATLIATGLAKDGLLLCAARSLALVRLSLAASAAGAESLLRGAGFPTDLLAHFEPGPVEGAVGVIGWINAQLAGSTPDRLRATLERVPFRWRPAAPGFAALPESGQVELKALRLQLTRGGYFAGAGDGGSLDITRQVLEKTRSRLLVHLEERHLPGLLREAAGWPRGQRDRLSLIAQDLPLSQWAQDSGKPGLLSSGAFATLLPRFASRGEETSQFVAGDSCVGEGLAALGRNVAHSPLLFQGGNLLVVQEPGGPRTMLIGEAEVYRNKSLGLSSEQALTALRTEFGVDRCVVLPAASIHIDYEVSIRTHGSEVVAFVNDTLGAARIMLEAGISVLRSGGRLSDSQADAAGAHLRAGGARELHALLWPLLTTASPSQFPLSLAESFRKGDADSGVGSFLRFLAALDVFAASSPAALAALSDPHQVAFLLACARQERDRAAVRHQLTGLGWSVVRIPSFTLGDRSINALNGLHLPNAYLMPAYGGIYTLLDRAATGAISDRLGPEVQIIAVDSGESQRRDGAVHCSVSALGG
jgi:hypothetical protein